MLDLRDVRAHLEGLTFPTGMVVTAHQEPHEGIQLWIVYSVPDSFDQGKLIDLGITSYLSPNDLLSSKHLDRYLVWRIADRIFSHEAREQIQRDGRPIDDPHATDEHWDDTADLVPGGPARYYKFGVSHDPTQ